ncbi:hypothetical protein KM1_216100 [Entamoeba histolytica HM-3:IMSS]|uniref:Uncharacterized protein n=1 Tax=Entamoeba histolytica HM-3:IMSS TaxID=885315 RepID=M7VVB5_ENTHI|nr:hypothetical protein KM1_216100 [Entamoeba histolytica HM-3:IMSS]
MTNYSRPHDDIYQDVASMDLVDVYTESQVEPSVNGLLKKFYYSMRDPSYLDWKLNNSDKVKTDEDKQDIIRNKLESIRRCERISRYLDECGIGLNSFNIWNRKFMKKSNKNRNSDMTIPEWIRKCSNKKCLDDVEKIVNEEEEHEAKRSLLRQLPKEGEKKPKKVETKE